MRQARPVDEWEYQLAMVGALPRMAAVIATAATAAASVSSDHGPAGPISSFGGATSVRVSHVGRIEVDIERSGVAGLRRVRCAGIAPGLAHCFVAR
jgi:hypothetical protein